MAGISAQQMSKSESEGSEGHVVVSPLESLPLHVFSHSAHVLSRVFTLSPCAITCFHTQPVSYQGVDAGQSDVGTSCRSLCLDEQVLSTDWSV